MSAAGGFGGEGLSAAGTARRRAGLLGPAELAFERDLAALARGLAEAGLEPEHAHLARELVELQPDLAPDERLAAIALVLCTFLAQQQGSARIALPLGSVRGSSLPDLHGADRPDPDGSGDLAGRMGQGRAGLNRAPSGRVVWDGPQDELDLLLSALVGEAEDGPSAAALRRTIEALVTRGRLSALLVDGTAPGEAFAPLVHEAGWLYHQNELARERRSAAALRRRLTEPLDAPPREEVQRALQDVLARAPRLAIDRAESASDREAVAGERERLSPHQQLAVLTPFLGGPSGGRSGLSLIVGPPGAGKTATLTALLRVAARLGIGAAEVALAAPTAKAAQRMSVALGSALGRIDDPAPEDALLQGAPPRARTLHRLLRWSPRRGCFVHGPARPLPERLVVVDEASMLDLALVDALLAALRPDATLVLVGDADQLPPVGVGGVLSELAPAQPTTDVPWRDLVGGALEDDAARSGPGASAAEIAGSSGSPPGPVPAAASSVEAGSDAPAGEASLLRVTRRLPSSFRVQASGAAGQQILAVAAAIRRGDADALLGDAGGARLASVARADELTFAGVEALFVAGAAGATSGAGSVGAARAGGTSVPEGFLERWFEAHVRGGPAHRGRLDAVYRTDERGRIAPEDEADARAVLAHHEAHKLLAVTNHGAAGVEALNEALHARHLRRIAWPSFHGPAVGDPVLFTRNDYALELFNGDTGVVLSCAAPTREPRAMAVFARGAQLVAFSLGALRERLLLAYALTVHRAQGSEHDVVGLVLPARHQPLLSRALLYTAVTRARRGVVLVGRDDVLRAGVLHHPLRGSGLRERVAGRGARPGDG